MSERVAAILNRYEDAGRYEVARYANHWVVIDTVTGVTRYSSMAFDAEYRAHNRAAQLNGLLSV